jgi:spermidine synthase
MSEHRRDADGEDAGDIALDEIQIDTGRAQVLADADRPGGYLLIIDRVRQSYVDLDDPTYLDFEYLQAIADVLDTMQPPPPGRLRVTHVGGGALTLARYVAAIRPGSSQVVLEPDTALIRMVRARLPLPPRSGIRVRPVGGAEGMAALPGAGADVVVLDAFLGARVPAELTGPGFLGDVARVLRPGGTLVANIADGPPLTYLRRVLATMRQQWAHQLVVADSSVLRGRRFGNLVLVASDTELAESAITRAAAAAAFPRRVLGGDELARFVGTVRPYSDADTVRSPAPPEHSWRVEV